MRFFSYVSLVLLMMAFLFSCKEEENYRKKESNRQLPDSVMQREKFAQIFTDVLLAESGVAQQYDPNESKIVKFEKYRYNIYKKHGIDSLTFRQNYNYYLGYPKRAELFLFIVEDTLEARKEVLRLE